MEKLTHNESGQLGLFVPIDHEAVLKPRVHAHVYEPVKRRLDGDVEATRACLNELMPHMRHAFFDSISDEAVDDVTPYWNNGFFAGNDARALFAFIATYKPKRYIEVGSGNSTRFARKAIMLESPETRLISIDPVPRAQVRSICDQVIEKSIFDVDVSLFRTLESGDILFHDGSHIVFNGTDTTHLFLEILPILASGVIVHIHDISLPHEYLDSFDFRGYNEQYMLAAFLLGGSDWEILLPLSYLNSIGILGEGGMSFWMRKR